ncbi:MAG: lipoprotein signal peptidase [Burkholderiales bacterium]|nr:MAG: lipoprotein signal peptidase [Burkholderiales bacterium]
MKRARLWPWLALAAALIALDQATKFAIERGFEYGERLPVLPGLFDLTLVYNRGAAFSFLAGADGWQRWFFTALGLVASVVIVWLLRRHGSQRVFASALTLILGGALGNVIDRLLHGHVVDFLLVYHQGWYWPAFNVADSAITVGAALLIIDELRRVIGSRSAGDDARPGR